MGATLYDLDVIAWANEQARLLRSGIPASLAVWPFGRCWLGADKKAAQTAGRGLAAA